MKKLLALFLLLPLFSANAFDKKADKKITVKNKSAQTKVLRHHQHNWHQRDYGYEVVLFKCFDSWGHNLRGMFTDEQQYLIELGGGSCRKINRQRQYTNLSRVTRYDFSEDYVFHAIEKIKRDYGLRRIKSVEALNVSAGFKTFKYTLIFKTKNHGYREFRVKHKRRDGRIRAVYEV